MALLRALARAAVAAPALAPSASLAASVVPHRVAALTARAPAHAAQRAFAAHRSLSTSSPALVARAASSSVGSGQGGRAEKDKAKREKEREQKEKAKAREARAKEKERKTKEKEKRQQQRIKDKEKREKEKEKRLREREKARALREKTKAEKAKSSTRTVIRPPKVPQNTWQIFFEEYIADRKRSLAPGEKLPSVTVMTQDAAPRYRSLEGAEKQSLQERYQAARDAYPAILEEWRQGLTPEMIRRENTVRATRRRLGLSRKRALRIEGEPKRPLTPFFRFCDEIREQGPDSAVLQGETAITKQSQLLARAWKELSEDERKPYVDAYTRAMEQYKREKAEWDAQQA